MLPLPACLASWTLRPAVLRRGGTLVLGRFDRRNNLLGREKKVNYPQNNLIGRDCSIGTIPRQLCHLRYIRGEISSRTRTTYLMMPRFHHHLGALMIIPIRQPDIMPAHGTVTLKRKILVSLCRVWLQGEHLTENGWHLHPTKVDPSYHAPVNRAPVPIAESHSDRCTCDTLGSGDGESEAGGNNDGDGAAKLTAESTSGRDQCDSVTCLRWLAKWSD